MNAEIGYEHGRTDYSDGWIEGWNDAASDSKNESLSVPTAKNNAVANTGKTPDDGKQVPLNKEGSTKPSGEAKNSPKTTGKPLSGDPQGQLGDSPSGDAPVIGKQSEGDCKCMAKTTGKPFAKDAEKHSYSGGGFKSLKKSHLNQTDTKSN